MPGFMWFSRYLAAYWGAIILWKIGLFGKMSRFFFFSVYGCTYEPVLYLSLYVRLINVDSLSDSAMTLLAYNDQEFSTCQSACAQETRYEISQQIQANIVLCGFRKFLKTLKNSPVLIKVVNWYNLKENINL